MNNFEIKRSNRKSMVIYIHRDQSVEVRAPLYASSNDIEQFIDAKQQWIQRKLEDFSKHPGIPENDYREKGILYHLGIPLTIEHHPTSIKLIDRIDSKLLIYGGKESHIESRLKKWEKQQAEDLFIATLADWHRRFPCTLPSYQLKIRSMRRQWGNCSSKGLITLSINLLRYPLDCIEYVVVHELTHLVHMDHSRRFYHLLEQVMPDWNERRMTLNLFSK